MDSILRNLHENAITTFWDGYNVIDMPQLSEEKQACQSKLEMQKNGLLIFVHKNEMGFDKGDELLLRWNRFLCSISAL